jgi:predicted house-cleaning noncanonical NTP pyrophosphatase (MazG superfamily)
MAWIREKLVRRHVPDQLRALGEKIETRIAEPDEMLQLLKAKLIEEVSELVEAIDAGAADQIVEELADVQEVIRAFGDQRLLRLTVMARQIEKREEKGTFTNVVMKLDEPVPSILLCPKCNTQHIDKDVWATTRVHRTHLCEGCGAIWRPYAYATVGVEALLPAGAP